MNMINIVWLRRDLRLTDNTALQHALKNGNKTAVLFIFDTNIIDELPPDYFDIVFSSPPYFTKEQYSEDENQSCNKFGDSLDSWINGFLKPVISNMYKITKPGGYFIINIADIKINGKIHDLETVTKEYSKECGFTFVELVKMKMGRTFGTIKRDKDGKPIDSEKYEPVFVFKK